MACSRYEYVDVGGLCKDCEVICPEQDGSWDLCMRDCQAYYQLLHQSSSAAIFEPTMSTPGVSNKRLTIGLTLTAAIVVIVAIVIFSVVKYLQRPHRDRADEPDRPELSASVGDTAEHRQRLLGGDSTSARLCEPDVSPSHREPDRPLSADVYDQDPVSYVAVNSQSEPDPTPASGADDSEESASRPQAYRGIHETGIRPRNLQTALLDESTLRDVHEQEMSPSASVTASLAAMSPAQEAHRAPNQAQDNDLSVEQQRYRMPPPCREPDTRTSERFNSQEPPTLPKDVYTEDEVEGVSELSLQLRGPVSAGNLDQGESIDSEYSHHENERTNLRLNINIPLSSSPTIDGDTLLTPTTEFTLASDIIPPSDVTEDHIGLSELNVRAMPGNPEPKNPES